MGSNAKTHVSESSDDVFKCVVIRDGRRTPFYAHTRTIALREARWFVQGNKLEEGTYHITDPVRVFANRPYI